MRECGRRLLFILLVSAVNSACVRVGFDLDAPARPDAAGDAGGTGDAGDASEQPDVGDLSDGSASDAGDTINASTWIQRVQPPNDRPTGSGFTEAIDLGLAVRDDGTVFVSWSDMSDGRLQMYLKYLEPQGSWQGLGNSGDVGGISATTSDTYACGLKLDAAGRPYVLWMERDRRNDFLGMFVRHWDGSAWATLPGQQPADPLDTEVNAFWPVMVLDSQDFPVIAWQALRLGLWSTYVARWNGTAWVGLDTSLSDGGISGPGEVELNAITLGRDGVVHVVWREIDVAGVHSSIQHRFFDGTTWRSFAGDISTPGRDVERPSIAITAANLPVVAWGYTDTHEVQVARVEGTTWTDVSDAPGTPASTGTANASNPNILTTDDDRLFLFFDADTAAGRGVYVRTWDAQAKRWKAMDGERALGLIEASSGTGGWPRAAISGGMLYVIWEEPDGNSGSAIRIYQHPI